MKPIRDLCKVSRVNRDHSIGVFRLSHAPRSGGALHKQISSWQCPAPPAISNRALPPFSPQHWSPSSGRARLPCLVPLSLLTYKYAADIAAQSCLEHSEMKSIRCVVLATVSALLFIWRNFSLYLLLISLLATAAQAYYVSHGLGILCKNTQALRSSSDLGECDWRSRTVHAISLNMRIRRGQSKNTSPWSGSHRVPVQQIGCSWALVKVFGASPF